MNHISDKNKLAVTEKVLISYENHINPKDYDEEKMLEMMSVDKCTNNWERFRDDCLQHIMCSEECSIIFYDKFFKLVHQIDPIYYEEQNDFLKFLNQIILWKKNDLKNQNVDKIIEIFSRLYEKSIEEKNNESMTQNLGVLSQTILDFSIKTHGTCVVVKLRNSFEKICEKTSDYELLYTLWRKLFER